MTTVGFATWNLNWFKRSPAWAESKLAFLYQQPWDVIALQEVTASMVGLVLQSGIAEHVAYSADVAPDWGFGSALLARNGAVIEQHCLLAELPNPNWGVVARIKFDDVAFTAASWHAPNAAKAENRAAKAAADRSVNHWGRGRQEPLENGADANHGAGWTRTRDWPGEPFQAIKEDDWLDENRFWAQPDHDLRDMWFEYLQDRPELVATLRVERPEGPSAISYTRGSSKNPTPDRFDYILASPEFSVTHMTYEYERAKVAGSDHAFVVSSLQLVLHH